LEIASGVGTPLLVDDTTKSRLFGIYARILVDVDMSEKLFNSVLVEGRDLLSRSKFSMKDILSFALIARI
jgi:hypothetical protein